MNYTGRYLFGAGISFALTKSLPAVPKVVLLTDAGCLFTILTLLGNLYAPGPGPSTLVGFKCSLLLMLASILFPNE